MSLKKNKLVQTHSPYLLQHADNPVEWYPWGEEALQRAKQENKPILLSIGYAACHWCHVMAHESFADAEIAKIMNKYFINIKVDREERPDIDKVYQLTHQLLNGRGGGWPLTVFLNPQNNMPFFSGTYFPNESRYGLPSFKQLLQEIANFYTLHNNTLQSQNQQLDFSLQHLRREPDPNNKIRLSASPLSMARQQLIQAFDAGHGGFGSAPKFPLWNNLEYLLHHWLASKRLENEDKKSLEIIKISLDKMAQGGIYDQIGGGFFRYAVDAAWEIPHFEKMLYDNAQALSLYAQAYAALKKPFYATVADATATWLLRDMQAPAGGFYASLDADSDGEEGKYYVWDQKELKQILPPQTYQIFAAYFGLENIANFETKWHFHLAKDLSTIAREQNQDINAIKMLMESARLQLLQFREQRNKPHLDTKILTSWNALTIKALIVAGLKLQNAEYLAAANKALNFLRKNCWVETNLMAVYNDKKNVAYQTAYLDDYAYLLDAVLFKLQVQWDSEDLQFAIVLAEKLLNDFEDKSNGGFFFTAHEQETLIQRPKTMMDEAIPAGNGVAALALTHLGHLIGERRYLIAAERTLKVAWPLLQTEAASAHMSVLMALKQVVQPIARVIIRGDVDEIRCWQQAVMKRNDPQCICFAIPRTITDLPTLLAACKPRLSATIAYVCQGMQCSAPVTELDKLLAVLQER